MLLTKFRTVPVNSFYMEDCVPSLLSLKHVKLKTAIVRFLRTRLKKGGRGSIKRSVLQRELTRALGHEAVLGNARREVEAKLNRAIGALRREQPPRLQADKGDDLIRLAK